MELRKLGAAVSQGISKSDYVKFIKTNSKKTLTKAIVLINKSSESIELGTGQDEDAMTLLNPWAFTEASIKASILAAVVGLSYTPIDLVSKGFLYLETGDKIEISEDSSMKWTSANGWSDGNIQSITTTWIGKQTLNIKRGLTSKYLMTGLSNNQSEFKFKGGLNQRVTTLDKTVVKKETAYYGVTIGKDKGIQVEKSDRSSELLLNSDVMAWKIKDTLGNMVDRLYLDSVSGELEFNGKLGVDAIEALKAEIDVVISNTVIINQLSAQKGNIAELTVDQLETSDKVQKYLVGDKTDVNYIKVFDKNIEFITAEVADATGEAPVTPTVQLKDRNNAPIFWLDDTHTGTTLDVTAFPVMIYVYTEAVKLKMAFDDSESKIPKISFGQGVGNPTYPDRGKGFVYKDTQGLVMEYLTEAGVLKQLRIGEDGVLGDIVESLESLNFYTNGFKAEYGNRHVGYRWTKDVSGRITQLADIYTSDVVPVVWNAGVL